MSCGEVNFTSTITKPTEEKNEWVNLLIMADQLMGEQFKQHFKNLINQLCMKKNRYKKLQSKC